MTDVPVNLSIESAIDHFLSIVMDHENEPKDLGVLISSLDELAYSVRFVGNSFDEAEYPEPPGTDYPAIRKVIEKRFPTLDSYKIATHVFDPMEKAELSMKDAIDDLVDMVSDLQKVVWRFNNTSEDDALWHFNLGYMCHWGRHLSFLQLYLHAPCVRLVVVNLTEQLVAHSMMGISCGGTPLAGFPPYIRLTRYQ